MSEKDIETSELVSQLRLRGVKPSQAFTVDELKNDPGFSKVIESEVDYKLWLKDKEAEEETNKQLDEETKTEEKMKEENDLIPGIDKEEEKKKKSEENPLIPGTKDEEDSGDDDLIPD